MLRVEPGRGFRLCDILTGSETEVIEKTGSQIAQIGDIRFARIVAVADLAVLDGCSPFAIPPQNKLAIIALRKRMQVAGGPVTDRSLDEWTEELLELYWDLVEPILNPRPPELRNTDDDPLLFHKLVFDVSSVNEAFDALCDLSVVQDRPSLLAEAKVGLNGVLSSVEIPWEKRGNKLHKHWDNTVLGRLLIEDTRLTAEVNSKRRAKTIRALIERRLGDRVRYRTTSTESPQSMLARTRKADERKKPGRTHEELVAIPEVREHLMQELRAHYEQWVDAPIPLLDGRTPREAVKTADGREAVAALVLQLERDGARMTPPLDPVIVRDVRTALGLQSD
ncbi:MAG: DUF2384 domain-containing protein [Betaproteobacteria bacterium]|nr:DUF2384 domain-containing protein [Betaproteobacteria bacterium]